MLPRRPILLPLRRSRRTTNKPTAISKHRDSLEQPLQAVFSYGLWCDQEEAHPPLACGCFCPSPLFLLFPGRCAPSPTVPSTLVPIKAPGPDTTWHPGRVFLFDRLSILGMTATGMSAAAAGAGGRLSLLMGTASACRTANALGPAALGLDDVPSGCQYHGSNGRCKDNIRHNHNLLSKSGYYFAAPLRAYSAASVRSVRFTRYTSTAAKAHTATRPGTKAAPRLPVVTKVPIW